MDRLESLAPQLVYEALGSSPEGLTSEEAARRLQQYGPNILREARKTPIVVKLLANFTNVMALLLWAAAGMAFVAEMPQLGVAVIGVIVINAVFSFWQEYKAERATEALKKLLPAHARVMRDGSEHLLLAEELVPGDLVLLSEGDLISADGRLVEEFELRTNNSTLTGESMPVRRSAEAVLRAAELGRTEIPNMVFAGTSVATGTGRAVVSATGMDTELGNIANLTQTVKEEASPIQVEVARTVRWITISAVALGALFFAIGALVAGMHAAEAFIFGVGIIVAFVPEGLLPTVTLSLAMGVQRMASRNALVKRLSAVETLGCTTVICTDKTGTLTQNEMTVLRLWAGGREFVASGYGYNPEGALEPADGRDPQGASHDLHLLLTIGALCNNARLLPPEQDSGRWTVLGDPTEAALVVSAARYGLWKNDLDKTFPRVAEVPFTSERKLMTTVHKVPIHTDSLVVNPYIRQMLESENLPYIAVTKGAVDQLLEISDRVWANDHFEPLTDEWRERIRDANEGLAKEGLRVLGVALRPLKELLPQPANADAASPYEQQLAIVGMVGMIDPPRPEVREAVQVCRNAGIRPVMITGDHPLTASAIARDLRIAGEGARTLAGQELNRLGQDDLENLVEEVSIYARVSPEDKLRIVQALQKRGHIVAMTGDGVNDSPALKKADIGVAMGITGTDVAKEAADAVLLDDNFATIVSAVEEGRVIYDNILRFIKYSIAGNLAKVLIMLLSPLIGITIALQPLQLLWLNLLTDGLMGLGLGLEPAEADTMNRPPRDPAGSLFGRGGARHIIWVGLLIMGLSMAVGYAYYSPHDRTWQTMIFTTVAFTQIGNAIGLRAIRKPGVAAWSSNPAMVVVVLSAVTLQAAAVYSPFLNRFFHVKPLAPADLGLCVILGLVVFVVVALEKRLSRAKGTARAG